MPVCSRPGTDCFILRSTTSSTRWARRTARSTSADFVRLRPEIVQTVLPTYTQFEPWIEGTSWDFYAALLRDYSVIGATPWSLFWARSGTSGPAPQQIWSAHLAPGSTSIDLPPVLGPDSGVVLLQVEFSYAVHNPLHVLPMVGGLPRYLVFEDGAIRRDPITLDPYTATARFPVVARRGNGVRLRWSAFSLVPGASIRVSDVKLWYVPMAAANSRWLTDLVNREVNRN